MNHSKTAKAEKLKYKFQKNNNNNNKKRKLTCISSKE